MTEKKARQLALRFERVRTHVERELVQLEAKLLRVSEYDDTELGKRNSDEAWLRENVAAELRELRLKVMHVA